MPFNTNSYPETGAVWVNVPPEPVVSVMRPFAVPVPSVEMPVIAVIVPTVSNDPIEKLLASTKVPQPEPAMQVPGFVDPVMAAPKVDTLLSTLFSVNIWPVVVRTPRPEARIAPAAAADCVSGPPV